MTWIQDDARVRKTTMPDGAGADAAGVAATAVGRDAAAIAVTPRRFNFRYRSAAHFLEVFRNWYGPMHKAFTALPADEAKALELELTALLDARNVAGAASLVVPGDYLEVVITRR